MPKKEVIATARYIRQSPTKVRAVVNMVKHLPFKEAVEVLEMSIKKAAVPLKKVLLSAAANAVHNTGLKEEDLRIKEIQVGPGPTMRRVKYRAKGRRDIMRKRSCHIRVVLEGSEKG